MAGTIAFAELRRERDLLAEQNRWLMERLDDFTRREKIFPSVWKLTPSQARILNLLLEKGFVKYGTIIEALYYDRDEPDAAGDVLKVSMCHLRRKLAPHGAKIITHWGQGYELVDPPTLGVNHAECVLSAHIPIDEKQRRVA
jgi:DNA-binding response OmpR family regulator